MNGSLLWWSRIGSLDILLKNLYAKILFAGNLILGVSTAQPSACNSEAIAAIHNLSDTSSTSIVSFSVSLLVLRNYESNNSGWHLLEEVSSKLRQCSLLWLVQACIKVTSRYKLADRCTPKLVRHALTALSAAASDIPVKCVWSMFPKTVIPSGGKNCEQDV